MILNFVIIVFLLFFIVMVIYFFKEGYSGIVKKSIGGLNFLLPLGISNYLPSRIYGKKARFSGFMYILLGISTAIIVIKIIIDLVSGWSQ